MFVIARGSSFRFRYPVPDVIEVGRALDVRYCVSGSVENATSEAVITVELADTGNGGVLWGERFAIAADEVHRVRSRIVTHIVNALELQIPLNEARLARRAEPENLDAWAAYHLGLQHTYRFNGQDNTIATHLFERAISLDPHFGRAHAGLSFTHFQSAFLRYSTEPTVVAAAAHRAAARAIELDPTDPFSNFTMGRSFWLEGDLENSLVWLDGATALSPNYAHGTYARAWAQTISGRGQEGLANVDTAFSLSPLDPLVQCSARAHLPMRC